jgi:hypothetical protein
MADEVEHRLDVDFELIAVNDQGELPVRPRLPNVVSRRGHALKIITRIHDVPNEADEFPVEVTINATVNVLANPIMGGEGDVSRLRQFWGDNAANPAKKTFNSRDELNDDITTIVRPPKHDDHLGQGPDFQADVTVTASPTTKRKAAADDEHTTAARPDRAAGTDSTSGTGDFIIPFSSR